MKCPPKGLDIEGLLGHQLRGDWIIEGSDFTLELSHPWIHNLNGLLRGGGNRTVGLEEVCHWGCAFEGYFLSLISSVFLLPGCHAMIFFCHRLLPPRYFASS
jgi:hypothetical protein